MPYQFDFAESKPSFPSDKKENRLRKPTPAHDVRIVLRLLPAVRKAWRNLHNVKLEYSTLKPNNLAPSCQSARYTSSSRMCSLSLCTITCLLFSCLLLHLANPYRGAYRQDDRQDGADAVKLTISPPPGRPPERNELLRCSDHCSRMQADQLQA